MVLTSGCRARQLVIRRQGLLIFLHRSPNRLLGWRELPRSCPADRGTRARTRTVGRVTNGGVRKSCPPAPCDAVVISNHPRASLGSHSIENNGGVLTARRCNYSPGRAFAIAGIEPAFPPRLVPEPGVTPGRGVQPRRFLGPLRLLVPATRANWCRHPNSHRDALLKGTRV